MSWTDEKLVASSLGPSSADTEWVLAIHALGATAVPNTAERSKLVWLRARSISDRLTAVIDAVLARS